MFGPTEFMMALPTPPSEPTKGDDPAEIAVEGSLLPTRPIPAASRDFRFCRELTRVTAFGALDRLC